MAFQQPTTATLQRVARPTAAEHDNVAVQARPASPGREAEESQTWVLFSPPTEVTTTSYLTGSEHSLQTPGRSRLSHFGSLGTIARSGEGSEARQSLSVLSAVEDEPSDEDAELDSLDSHLPGFRSNNSGLKPPPRSSPHGVPVFPAHDGLGSFRLDQPVLDAEAQNQIYQFEQFNPRKVRRRLDSFDHTPSNLEGLYGQEEDKRQRIEAWRLEHSRVLLDEVQRETRRRRKSLASMQRSRRPTEVESDDLTWHDEEALEPEGLQEGFLAGITRRVVKDLLGIDDAMLSILLGEELPGEDEEALSSTPRASQLGNQPILTAADEPSWQIRILERLSKELGILVHQLSPHPGAFETYSKMQHMPVPYAGLPAIPESAGTATPRNEPGTQSQARVPEFQPTMHSHSQPVGIPDKQQTPRDGCGEERGVTDGDFTKEEWEKSLDVKLVLRYLVTRFTSRSSTSSSCSTPHREPTPQADSVQVARVRQHHPLIARNHPPVERRHYKAALSGSPATLRHHSSCASQSTRRSTRRSSCSSRHYWDIGGSLGTGSVIASNGPMGSWGEV
ncbi:hypothetical protein UVI_02033830 [Ustilaginoidea virens]|uniref:Uncharacterized protein n=1 Tax=Ustilaginoidea virens TaxID=1159556 RepID=A0A1B5KTU5_USTVR|nr:hypothetical protein UVI_02033830 [Ustilaginoidea virens]